MYFSDFFLKTFQFSGSAFTQSIETNFSMCWFLEMRSEWFAVE